MHAIPNASHAHETRFDRRWVSACIGLTPVWVAAKLSVNEVDARKLAIWLADLDRHVGADWIFVARRVVGIVGVETLHTARRAPDAAAWAVRRPFGESRVAFVGVPGVGFANPLGECGVRVEPGLSLSHATASFDAGDTSVREGAREPVASRKRLAIVEQGWNLHYDRKPEVTATQHTGVGPQRTPDLDREHLIVASLRHETRMRSLTSDQKSDSPTTSTIMTASAAARSALEPDPRSRAQMSSAIARRVASSVRASAK